MSARSWSRRHIYRLVMGIFEMPKGLPGMTRVGGTAVSPLRSPIGKKVPGMGTFADYDGNNFRLREGESKDLDYRHCQTTC